jgi:hypothetical protein
MTLFFSQDCIPNLTTVIPAMDHIDEVLTTNATDQQFSVSIQAALTVGKKTLNCYYGKTDFSEVHRITMGVQSFFTLLSDILTPTLSSAPSSQAQVFQ